MRQGVVCLDQEWRIVSLDDEAALILGDDARDGEFLADVAEIILDRALASVHAESGKELEPHPRSGFNLHVGPGSCIRDEALLRRCDNERVPVYLSLSPLWLEEGKLGMVLQLRDISQRLQVEHQVDKARVEAAAAARDSELKSQFLATMSHEIRTPMNGVLGMLALLLDTTLDEEQRDLATTAHRSAEALLGILNDILDLSKLEAGRCELEALHLNLREAICDVLMIQQKNVSDRGLVLASEVAPDVPQIVVADPTRIRQVLMNLVSNAVKFTHRGSVTLQVKVAQTALGQSLVFEVIDTGVGIAADKIGRLFRPFTQADASTTRQFGGTGLGLTISKRLIEMMGGEIGVESLLGQGSTFRFVLPLVEHPAAGAQNDYVPTSAQSPDEVPPSLGLLPDSSSLANEAEEKMQRSDPIGHEALAQPVLVVDDNAINRKFAAKVLEKLGYRYETASDGKEAMRRVRAEQYSAVLMDCMMPEMDGYEATRQIRAWEQASSGRIPIIALSANAMAGDRERALEAGMDDYIAKPVRPNDLGRALLHWCGSPD